ncbi:hypothetical protein NIES2100_70770 [Calothrix sp. NIES-2100]|nr:hypothetical protein NIES2100_70770 [Calothrix sp. NIES-2100]
MGQTSKQQYTASFTNLDFYLRYVLTIMPHLNFYRVTQYLAKIVTDVVISLTFVNHSSGKIRYGVWGMGHGAWGIGHCGRGRWGRKLLSPPCPPCHPCSPAIPYSPSVAAASPLSAAFSGDDSASASSSGVLKEPSGTSSTDECSKSQSTIFSVVRSFSTTERSLS